MGLSTHGWSLARLLACARLRHVATSKWGEKRYLNMEMLKDA